VASVDALSPPFATWQEGLRKLAAALHDPTLEKIIVARLEATEAENGISLKEICSLALLVPSRARFDPQTLIKWEPNPRAVALAAKLAQNETITRHITEHIDALEYLDQKRKDEVFSVFPETDPRRLLTDTVLGFAAAELSDVSQRLGEADPFLRLARRLSLWFKPWLDHSRYGIALASDGDTVVGAVRRAIESFNDGDATRIRRLIHIWAGDVGVEASPEGIREIASLLSLFDGPDIGQLDGILALEIYSALVDQIEELDVETLNALSHAFNLMPSMLSDGSPFTSNYHTWLETRLKGGERFRLAYDPSRVFASAEYSDNADVLKPLLSTTLEAIGQRGHTLFATGPLPIRGTIFNRDSLMFQMLSEHAPEAADLIRLLGTDGDYCDQNGPCPAQSYWTGDYDSNAITIPEVVDRAFERGDQALCDMLIGCWILFCSLFEQVPLPDAVGLARRITALPMDHRSSTYAVLSVLKREAAENVRLRCDMDALLSWLPLVDIAPPEDFEAYMRDLFSPRLWDTVDNEEKERLVEAEETFVRIRRLNQQERQNERLRLLVIDWSAVAERVLCRALSSLDRSAGLSSTGQPLGTLIGEMRNSLKRAGNAWSSEDKPRAPQVRYALNVLDQLNRMNTKGAKHLGGTVLTWEDVVHVHAGLYWALKALLDATSSLAAIRKH